VGLEQGPLSLVSTTVELPGRSSSGSGLEIREYGRRDPLCSLRDTLYGQQVGITSPTSCGSSVGIDRSQIKAMESVSLYLRDKACVYLQKEARAGCSLSEVCMLYCAGLSIHLLYC
jgi:hypothetical protein